MTRQSRIFDHSHPYTLGVEEEYMLCDPGTGEMINRVNQFMAALPKDKIARYSYELILSELECNTTVCQHVSEALNEIISLRQLARDLGRDLGFVLGISGTHPTARPDDMEFVDSEGYNWVQEQMQQYARQNITFATHVHVAVPNAETAVHTSNGLRRWIPALTALSVNSPFFAGVNTGVLSARTLQFGIFPRTNIQGTFRNFQEYEKLVEDWKRTGTIAKPRHIWWKIRPHMEFGTIEFRMFDVQRSLKRLELQIALSQALVYQSVEDYQDGSLVEDLSLEYLNDGLWKAVRFNHNSEVVDSATGRILTLKEFIRLMADYCRPALDHFGTGSVLSALEDILQNGTEAQEQLDIYQQSGMEGLKHFLINNVEYQIDD